MGQIHRFHGFAAVSLRGKGETRYLTATEARKMARALNAVAKSITVEPFGKSSGLTVEFDDKSLQEQWNEVERSEEHAKGTSTTRTGQDKRARRRSAMLARLAK